jgi:DNA polymerase III gamma/tau subunit
LKVLEEPPSYGVFILLTDNPEKVLTTVRSRAVELSLQSLPREVLTRELKKQFPDTDEDTLSGVVIRSGGYLGQAKTLLEDGAAVSPQTEGFAKSYAAKDAVGLVQVLVPMEKWKRDRLLEALLQWKTLFAEALACRGGGTAPRMNSLKGRIL